jgi:hemerythrin-like domain-containing protein/rubredoxin
MLPIGLLMREHRLIERMVANLRVETERVKENRLDPVFIDQAVDFFRTYADRTHHGKEENILFRDLQAKSLKPEHKAIMDELVSEHVYARRTVGELLEAKEKYLKGDPEALHVVEERLNALIELYPAHIEKEDRRFFYPVMEYFSSDEQESMLQQFYVFDQKMIHEKYGSIVDYVEKRILDSSMMRCRVCGYIYDPMKGDPEHGVKRGTVFEELPPDWVCPVCFAPKEMFEKA